MDGFDGFDGFNESERIMINLEVLGNIKGTEKISIRGPYLSLECHTPIITPLKRRIKGDNRREIIVKIVQLANSAIDILKSDEITEKMKENIKGEIPNTIKGLEKMQETYDDDAITVSQLDVICKKLENAIEQEGSKKDV